MIWRRLNKLEKTEKENRKLRESEMEEMEKLSKKDYFSMIVSAYAVILPVAIIVLVGLYLITKTVFGLW